MNVLGVLACQILEQEVAALLAADRDVARVTVVADARSAALAADLEARGLPEVHRIPHARAFVPEPGPGLDVLVRVLELALHRRPALLRRAVADAVAELAPRVDALWLGYGRCGRALDGVAELPAGRTPLFVPEDAAGPVDDCVALLLGGRAPYRREQLGTPGTFFMTPGWARHWSGVFGDGPGGAVPATMRRLFARYERALLVVPPGASREAMRAEVERFSAPLGLRVEACPGTTALLAGAWARAKARLLRPGEEAAC